MPIWVIEIMLAYHLTRYENLVEIRRKGLLASMPSVYEHVGKGIYVIFDKQHVADFADYLGFDALFLCVTVEVSRDDLLMDEDALIIGDYHEPEDLQKIMPQQAYKRYLRYLEQNDGGDELAINDERVARFKVGLIDRYKIRPHPEFTADWGHYSVLTARCAVARLAPTDVEVYYDGEYFDPDDAEIVQLASELEDDYGGGIR